MNYGHVITISQGPGEARSGMARRGAVWPGAAW